MLNSDSDKKRKFSPLKLNKVLDMNIITQESLVESNGSKIFTESQKQKSGVGGVAEKAINPLTRKANVENKRVNEFMIKSYHVKINNESKFSNNNSKTEFLTNSSLGEKAQTEKLIDLIKSPRILENNDNKVQEPTASSQLLIYNTEELKYEFHNDSVTPKEFIEGMQKAIEMSSITERTEALQIQSNKQNQLSPSKISPLHPNSDQESHPSSARDEFLLKVPSLKSVQDIENFSNFGNIVAQSQNQVNLTSQANNERKYRKPKTIDPFSKLQSNTSATSLYVHEKPPINKNAEKDKSILINSRNPSHNLDIVGDSKTGFNVLTSYQSHNDDKKHNDDRKPTNNKERSQIILSRLENLLGNFEEENTVNRELMKGYLENTSDRIREESEDDGNEKLTASRESLFKPFSGTRTLSNRYILPADEL